jgi:hypothetical protein
LAFKDVGQCYLAFALTDARPALGATSDITESASGVNVGAVASCRIPISCTPPSYPLLGTLFRRFPNVQFDTSWLLSEGRGWTEIGDWAFLSFLFPT